MDKEKALNKIAGMCSKKEYCTGEIREKLTNWELPEKEIREMIEFLTHHKFIDDRRFALAYAEDKFRFNHWGKQKIAQMLHRKRIAPEILQEALANIDGGNYEAGCMEILQQKLKSLPAEEPYKIKAKLIRFALGRGFDYDTVSKCLSRLSFMENED